MEPKYIEYLDSPEWRAVREQRLTKDKYTCRACGNTKNLQVHHLSYSNIYHEKMEDLVTLCQECHSRLHKEKNDIKNAQEEKRKEKFDKAMSGNEENIGKLCEDMKKLKLITIEEFLTYISPILNKIKSSPTYAIEKILDLLEEYDIYTISSYNDAFAIRYNLLFCNDYTCLGNNFICHAYKEELNDIRKSRTMCITFIHKVWKNDNSSERSFSQKQGQLKIRLWEEKGLTREENDKFSKLMDIGYLCNRTISLNLLMDLRHYYFLLKEESKPYIDWILKFLKIENMIKAEKNNVEEEYNKYIERKNR